MIQLITLLHIFIAVAIIILVLLQQGKGSDVGAAFGSGASNTMFGSTGSAPFLMKLTAVLAAVFFITSLSLSFFVAKVYKKSEASEVSSSLSQPIPVQSQPLKTKQGTTSTPANPIPVPKS